MKHMKLRDMMFLVIGGLLVISGMVLNTLISGDAEAQEGLKDGKFRNVICEGIVVKNLFIVEDGYKMKGSFGIGDGSTDGTAVLQIYGDDGKTSVAYLGVDAISNEMKLSLRSKSKTDKRVVMMSIDKNGGRFDSNNKMGEQVIRLAVGSDGGGVMITTDKFGNKR